MVLSILYNPYLLESKFKVNGKSANKTPWAQYLRRRRLQTWFYPAPNWRGFAIEVQEALNEREVSIEFEGRRIDYQDLKLFCDQWNSESNKDHKTHFVLLEQKSELREDKNVLQELDKLVATFKDSPVEELRSEELQRRYQQERKNDFDMAVVATMSSGKSTLINALLGRDLLPAANDATTAKITRIHDCDSKEGFTVECRTQQEELIFEDKPATPELLDEYNRNDKVFYVDLDGDIPGISGSMLRLNILDTPGPNNSATQEHRDVTNSVLHDKERQPIILYVMDSTKPEDESDAALLKDIAETMKRGGKQTQERFVFVMNKADMLNKADGAIGDILRRRQAYLHRCGIDATQIIPVSANTAKLLRMEHNGLPLSEDDMDDLPGNLNKLRRKHLHEEALLSPACRHKLEQMKKEAEEQKDQYMLDLICTGIIGLELTINEYLEKYAYPYKISRIIETFKKKLDEEQMHSKYAAQMAESEENLQKAIEALEKATRKKKELDEKAAEIESEIKTISFDRNEIINFSIKFEDKVEQALQSKVKKDISVTLQNSFLKELEQSQKELITSTQTALYKMLNDQIHQNFDPIYGLIRELQSSFKQLEIEGVDFSKVEGLTDLDDMLNLMELEDLADILNDGDYIYETSHEETRVRDNPERAGFFGFFKIWKPKTITETITVSDGKYINVKRLYSVLVKALREDFDERFEKMEGCGITLFQKKQKECEAFVKKISEEQEKELTYLRALTEQIQNRKLDLEENKKRIRWMEDCDMTLSRIV